MKNWQFDNNKNLSSVCVCVCVFVCNVNFESVECAASTVGEQRDSSGKQCEERRSNDNNSKCKCDDIVGIGE